MKYADKLGIPYILIIGEEERETILRLIDEIGQKRGAMLSGGRIDYEKVSNIVLDDFRSGKIGKITLEHK